MFAIAARRRSPAVGRDRVERVERRPRTHDGALGSGARAHASSPRAGSTGRAAGPRHDDVTEGGEQLAERSLDRLDAPWPPRIRGRPHGRAVRCHHAPMQIHFLGGATTVTGSQFLLVTERARVLIDCGMFQGSPNESVRNRSRSRSTRPSSTRSC